MSRSTARVVIVATVLTSLCVLQSPGLLTADTKFDLVEDPAQYLAASLHAWAPRGQFGEVQNQAYGYLWPMGPFFLLGHSLGIAEWLVQRLWWAVVLLVGFEGARRLLGRLGIGTPGSQIVGALAYVLAPRVLGLLGTTSVEAWPAMVLPWMLLPLTTRGSPLRAALLSGAAALLLGGVNAVANIAVLCVPAVWLLLANGLDRRVVRLAWWGLATLLACAWWLGPLVVLAGSAYPFLDYIESAGVTTAVTTLRNVLRGSEHWVAWSGSAAGPSWTAGFDLAVQPLLVLATALVGGMGLAGLALRSPRVPHQRFLLVLLVTGCALMSMGYAGAHGGPWAEPVRVLLDGPLAPFRNVHKLDPWVRLPVAVGLSHLLARLIAASSRAPAGGRRSQPSWAVPAAVSAVAAVLVTACSPVVLGTVASRGAFPEVPGAWRAAAAWLDDHAPEGRVLVLPASNFGEYTWGRPLDEPLTSMSAASWVLRNAVPLGAPGATRWMDAVDELVRSGRGDDELSEVLAAVGISHVLLRNDLSVDQPRTPAAAVRAAIATSPGFVRVAGFGGPAETFLDSQAVTGDFLPDQLEVFQVSSPQVRGQVADHALVVRGGPEASVVSGLAQVPWVAAADSPDLVDVTTDTLPRRSQNFGAERGFDTTPVLTAEDDARRGRPVSDVSPFPEDSPRSMTRLVGEVRRVTASSSRADPFGIGYSGPGARPFLAVDGRPSTAWLPAPDDDDPELRLDLVRPAQDLTVRLTSPAEDARVTVATPEGTSETQPVTGIARVHLDAPATVLTIRVARRAGAGVVGITEVTGLSGGTDEVRDVPDPGAPGFVVSRSDGGRRACLDLGPEWACSDAWARQPEESGPLRRPGLVAGSGEPEVRVRAVPGAALDSVLDRAAGVLVDASSSGFDDPAARGGAAVDADDRTAWIPSSADVAPTLRVRTSQPRASSTFRLGVDRRFTGLTATVVADGRPLTRGVRPGQRVRFPAVTATTWTVQLTRSDETPVPIRVAELDFGWEPPQSVAVRCDAGLGFILGDRTYPVSLTTTVSALVEGRALEARVCPGSASSADVGGLRSRDLAWLQVTRVAWLPSAPGATAVPVRAPDPESRHVAVPAGPAGRILVLAEGANPGWRAMITPAPADAAPDSAAPALLPVRVAGWQQGWELPALSGPATVEVRFEPGRGHRIGLGVGAALALLLVVGAAWAARRGPRGDLLREPERGSSPLAVAGGLVLVAALTTGGAGVVAAAVTLALLARRRPGDLGVAVLVTSATALGALAVLWSAIPAGWDQLACIVALSVTATGLAREGARRGLDEGQGHPSQSHREDQNGAEQEQGVPAEQR